MISSEFFFLLLLQGRNDFSIFVITRELGILTWDEAFLSLRSPLLPDALRAKYCELIIGKLAAFQPSLVTFIEFWWLNKKVIEGHFVPNGWRCKYVDIICCICYIHLWQVCSSMLELTILCLTTPTCHLYMKMCCLQVRMQMENL